MSSMCWERWKTGASRLAPRTNSIPTSVADICMPSLNGIDAARRLKEAGSKAKLISLCAATAK